MGLAEQAADRLRFGDVRRPGRGAQRLAGELAHPLGEIDRRDEPEIVGPGPGRRRCVARRPPGRRR